MPDTKFEEAKRCPTCGNPSDETGVTNLSGGDKLHHFLCRNVRCRHFDLGHVVQVNSDGSIPEYKTGPKIYPEQSFSGGKRYIQNLEEELERGEVS